MAAAVPCAVRSLPGAAALPSACLAAALDALLPWGRARRSGWTAGIARRRFTSVALSQRRLLEFIKAELEYFGQQTPEPMGLERIVQASTPAKAASLLHQEMPRRFAARVKLIQSLEGWQDQPELSRLCDIFTTSFRELRLNEPHLTSSVADLAPYSEVISALRERHMPVTALLGEALRKMRRGVPAEDDHTQAWANAFFNSRISTEMLTNHYVAIVNNPPSSGSKSFGVVDLSCNPGLICQRAAEQVRCSLLSSMVDSLPELAINVRVQSCTHSGREIEIPYIPQYLFYIVQELLRNSARATLDLQKVRGDAMGPISVTVCSDHKQVAIRISDQGGGVPFGNGHKIWLYQFSTSLQPYEAYLDGASPLSGWGMGLPLARLYANYLGGSLELMNMPGIGVDAYLFLHRIPHVGESALADGINV